MSIKNRERRQMERNSANEGRWREKFNAALDKIDKKLKMDAHMDHSWMQAKFRKPAPFHNGRKP